MAFFVEEITNKIDKKGRTSLPAAYRSELDHSEFYGIIIFKSLDQPCYVGADLEFMKDLFDRVAKQHGPYSKEMKTFRRKVMSGSKRLSVDSDGRMIVPQAVRDQIGITDKILFSGGGDHFEIWSPEAFEASDAGGDADALNILNNLKPKDDEPSMADFFGGGRK